MEAFFGKKYIMTYEENLAEYLSFTGIKKISQGLMFRMKAVFCLTRTSDGVYTLSLSTEFKHLEYVFLPGEEFDDIDLDNRKGKSVITIDGNVMTIIQRSANGKISKTISHYYHDKIIMITTALGFKKTVKRHLELVQ
ncbi:fatty acid-binding protein, liver-like [Achroia grisella]|uniref:fatty acid-binding protein, liver-like n=1 Tax=Achroia grisella TaxID=688607 RepID=UPI0027D29E9F|nr:fatty acid-binding protein, liver-like [Achroia grisella]